MPILYLLTSSTSYEPVLLSGYVLAYTDRDCAAAMATAISMQYPEVYPTLALLEVPESTIPGFTDRMMGDDGNIKGIILLFGDIICLSTKLKNGKLVLYAPAKKRIPKPILKDLIRVNKNKDTILKDAVAFFQPFSPEKH